MGFQRFRDFTGIERTVHFNHSNGTDWETATGRAKRAERPLWGGRQTEIDRERGVVGGEFVVSENRHKILKEGSKTVRGTMFTVRRLPRGFSGLAGGFVRD